MGATIRDLMGRAGHASSNAALRYQHAVDAADEALAERLNRLATE